MKQYRLAGLILALGVLLLALGCGERAAMQAVPAVSQDEASKPETAPASARPQAPPEKAVSPTKKPVPSPPLKKAPTQSVSAADKTGPPSAARPEQIEEKTLNWRNNFDAARQEGAQTGKPLLLFFHTEWCGYCKLMLEQTFPHPGIISLITKKFIPVKIDAEREAALAQRYGITGYPTTVIVDAQEKEVARVAGYLPPQNFQEVLAGLPASK